MPEISGEAKVGKILMLIGLIMGIFGAIVCIILGAVILAFSTSELVEQTGLSLFGGFYLVWGILMAIGAVLTIIAYKKASENNFHKAGILALIGSLIPPLNLFGLIGAILCMLSKEAKEKHHY